MLQFCDITLKRPTTAGNSTHAATRLALGSSTSTNFPLLFIAISWLTTPLQCWTSKWMHSKTSSHCYPAI